MVFRSTANRIADIVSVDRCYRGFSTPTANSLASLLYSLAELGGVQLASVGIHRERRGLTVLEVTCADRTETIRISRADTTFPPSVFVAYLNAKLADVGSDDRLVAARDGTVQVVALCDPDQQHELRACIFACLDDLRWPAARMHDTERELLDAIRLAAPDDDGPRLVYADWLTERGDRRGELITLQCHPELAVRDRASHILAIHEPTWTSQLPTWVHAPHFERGFISKVWADRRDRRLDLVPAPDIWFYDDAEV